MAMFLLLYVITHWKKEFASPSYNLEMNGFRVLLAKRGLFQSKCNKVSNELEKDVWLKSASSRSSVAFPW